jgi:probable rRNA maturation factor
MITIDVQNIQESIDIDVAVLKKYVKIALGFLDIKDAELSIVIGDNKFIQNLNKHYLGKDRPTNVISFSQQEGLGPKSIHLGDVVISAQRAFEEAEQAGISVQERIKQLLIHGICHLTGYNHEGVSEKKAKEMAAMEAVILKKIDESGK